MMNPILHQQNEPRQIDRLAAQRQLYSDSKRWQLAHFVMSVPCVVMLALVTLAFPVLKPWAWLWSLLIVLLDFGIFSVRQEELRTRAAQIQEIFDGEVLELPLRDLKGAARVPIEAIDKAAHRYKQSHTDISDLSNWYSVEIAPLPVPLARIICQRTNCWWDSEVRRRYATTLLWGLIGLTLFVVILGLFRNTTVADWFVSVLAPPFPMLLWGWRQIRDQNKTATKLDKLREHAEKLWNQALSNASSLQDFANKSPEMQSEARELQDEIFEHRRTNQPMFDAIHRRVHDDMEARMNRGAKYYVEQALNKFKPQRDS